MRIENEEKLDQIIQAFSEAGFLDDVILIGSWCLPFYAEILEGFTPTVRTTDIDFYVPDSKRANAENLSSRLKEINYDHFQDTMTSKSRFVSPEGFEIEFLAKLNREGLSCVRLGASGIYAESLSYVDIYGANYIEAKRGGLSFKVASPSAFAIQKILINDKRGAKAEKDAEAIDYVLLFIKASKKSGIEFYSLFDSLPKKWQKKILDYVKRRNVTLPPRL